MKVGRVEPLPHGLPSAPGPIHCEICGQRILNCEVAGFDHDLCGYLDQACFRDVMQVQAQIVGLEWKTGIRLPTDDEAFEFFNKG